MIDKEKTLLKYIAVLDSVIGRMKFSTDIGSFEADCLEIDALSASIRVNDCCTGNVLSPTALTLRIFNKILEKIFDTGHAINSPQTITEIKKFNDRFESDFSKVRKTVCETFERDKGSKGLLKNISCDDSELIKGLDKAIRDLSEIRSMIEK